MSRPFRPEMLQPPPGLDLAGLSRFLLGSGPLDLEIGCGVGWHPIQYAKTNPDRRLIAIERTREKFERFRSRLERQPELTNLLPVHAHGVPWLVHAFPEVRPVFERVFLLYPNPSPKNPAERWIRMPFFGFLLERVVPGGEILIASNERGYLEEVLIHAGDFSSPGMELRASPLRPVRLEGGPRTHFERKYLERGEECLEVSLTRVAQ